MVKPDPAQLRIMTSMLQVEEDYVAKQAVSIIQGTHTAITRILAETSQGGDTEIRRAIKDELQKTLVEIGVTDSTAHQIADYMEKISVSQVERG